MASAGKVLLVEDEVLIQDLLCLELEDAGFEVCCADDGAKALAELGPDTLFSALVTDVNLGGGVDGWEVARQARAIAARMPVLYMTGDSEHVWQEKGVEHSLLVGKPFTPPQVVSALQSLLAR